MNVRTLGYILMAVTALTLPLKISARSALQILDTLRWEYNAFDWKDIDRIKVRNEAGATLMNIYGNCPEFEFKVEDCQIVNGATVPMLIITTDEAMEEIPDKINYHSATIQIKGLSGYEDFEEKVSIRGRGNTSWVLWDKKPYRLKFDKKQQLCGLKKAKSYVLTANWTDISLMQNPIAGFLGNLLGVAYTHTYVPVDVVLNGVYRGSYLLTNKPGINAGSVDIDEATSVMWELDVSYDEEFKFRSPVYDLPVMLQDPDMDSERFEYWKQDFIAMEKAVSEGNVEEWIDLDNYARYRMVYEILYNKEVGHPKSVKIYKTEGGKYHMGPIWDFDVALGFLFNQDLSYTDAEIHYDVWVNKLMEDIEKDEKCQQLIRYYFYEFLNQEDLLWEFIDTYEQTIRDTALRNNLKWPQRGDWEQNIVDMKSWLRRRIQILKNKFR